MKLNSNNKRSLFLLIISNLIVLVFALLQSWDILLIIWTYWLQSIIIGFFHFLKFLSFKNFSISHVNLNGALYRHKNLIKYLFAFSFLIQFLFFHIVYFFFLTKEVLPENLLQSLALAGIFFFINHLYSFLYYKKQENSKKIELREFSKLPYKRLVPMHIIIFGFFVGNYAGSTVLIAFSIMKTIADAYGHILEHK